MRNLVLVKARLARGGMLAIGQSASEPEPHRVRSASLAIGADDLDARGRSPMCCQRTRPSLGGEAGGSLPRLHLTYPSSQVRALVLKTDGYGPPIELGIWSLSAHGHFGA